MSRFLVTGEQRVFYELEIYASSHTEAEALARRIIIEDAVLPAMQTFYSDDPGRLDLETSQIDWKDSTK